MNTEEKQLIQKIDMMNLHEDVQMWLSDYFAPLLSESTDDFYDVCGEWADGLIEAVKATREYL